MATAFCLGLLAALLVGGATGWLATFGYFERIKREQREYEREVAEAQEMLAARAMLRQMKGQPRGEED